MITIFLNPASGATKDVNFSTQLADMFHAAGSPAQIVVIESATNTADAVRSALRSGVDVVVAAGGDGTVSTIAGALVGSHIPLGVIPVGTLNHFAKDLHIPLDLKAAVQTIAARHATTIDVGEVNGRVFVNNSSIGIYPNIVVERDRLRRQGYRKWTAFVAATAKIVRRYRGVVVRIAGGGSTRTSRTPFLFVGNNEYHVDGIHLGARDRLDGGQLFAYLAPRLRGHELPRSVGLALLGRAGTRDMLESFGAADLRVDRPGHRRVRVAADGEVAVMDTPLQYRIRPRALDVIVPAR